MKRVWILVITIFMLVSLTGCNRQIIDTTYHYDRAVVCLPNGEVVEGKIQNWRDYPDGDQIQVKIGGTTYLVHSSMVALISE